MHGDAMLTDGVNSAPDVAIEGDGTILGRRRVRTLDLCATMTYILVDDETQEAAMLAFDDMTNDVQERSSERMNFRTKPRIKQTIQRAAALSGVDDSVFTMNAAYRSALETIAAHERTALQPADHAAFFAALDNPSAPTAKLRDAFTRHGKTIDSQ